MSFTLLVIMRFETQEAKSAWCDSLIILSKHVRENEPGTLQYQFSVSVDDPLVITIFETYRSKSDFEDVHIKSPAFLEHVAKMKPYEDQIKTERFIQGDVLEEFGYFSK